MALPVCVHEIRGDKNEEQSMLEMLRIRRPVRQPGGMIRDGTLNLLVEALGGSTNFRNDVKAGTCSAEGKHGGGLQQSGRSGLVSANYQRLPIPKRGMATGQRLVVSIEGKEEVGFLQS